MNISRVITAASFLLLTGVTQAGTISLAPVSPTVALGNQASFTLFMDFSGEATVGGGFDVVYDDTRLDFVSFTFDSGLLSASDPLLTCPGAAGCNPAIDQPGVVTNIAFGNFGGLSGPMAVGTLIFDTLSIGNTLLSTQTTTGSAGPFVSALTFEPQAMTFLGTSLDIPGGSPSPVPVPAAFWLMLSGIGVLGRVLVRKK